MILKTQNIQELSQKILSTSVDKNIQDAFSGLLEIKVENSILTLIVANNEYHVEVGLKLEDTENQYFRAVVNANLFLQLISKLTTNEIELIVEDTYLLVKGNGTYKLPLNFDVDGNLTVLPQIEIENETKTFEISGDCLNSILTFNSKEIDSDVRLAIQKLYYLDEEGCITFTSGACVNTFNLPAQVKLLLTDKIVKLFKLFKNETVKVSVGHRVYGDVLQQVIKFETSFVKLTCVLLEDEDLLLRVPVSAIRGLANKNYKYCVQVDRENLLATIDRLALFDTNKLSLNAGDFIFNKTGLVIKDKSENSEEISYAQEIEIETPYTCSLSLSKLKKVLSGVVEQYILIYFEESSKAIVVARGNIKNVIPLIVKID